MQKHGAAENLNLSTPAFALTVVDLSKVKHLPLYGLATPAAPIFHMHFDPKLQHYHCGGPEAI